MVINASVPAAFEVWLMKSRETLGPVNRITRHLMLLAFIAGWEKREARRQGAVMSEYTPTMDDLFDVALHGARAATAEVGQELDEEEFTAQFKRCIAAHDREVAAEAIKNLAGRYWSEVNLNRTRETFDWIKARAEATRIENGETDEH